VNIPYAVARRIEYWQQEVRAHQRHTMLPNGIGSHADRAAARARRHLKFWQAVRALLEGVTDEQ
jgi:hypothetical protein